MTVGPDDILAFWNALGPGGWYAVDDVVDAAIRDRFHPAWRAARGGAFRDWCTTPEGALAYLILTDQFPRNMFRGSARAFAADRLARAAADRALARGFDGAVAKAERGFFYLPFMHSEDLADQERCVALYRAADIPEGLRFAHSHADIIRRFGRFPHRNAALGRATTQEEKAFLDAGGFAG